MAKSIPSPNQSLLKFEQFRDEAFIVFGFLRAGAISISGGLLDLAQATPDQGQSCPKTTSSPHQVRQKYELIGFLLEQGPATDGPQIKQPHRANAAPPRSHIIPSIVAHPGRVKACLAGRDESLGSFLDRLGTRPTRVGNLAEN